MATKKNQEKILKEYKKESDVILQKMMQVLLRAHRKVDDQAYRNVLEKIESIERQKGGK